MRTPDCLVDPVPEFGAVFLVMVTELVVDNLFLWFIFVPCHCVFLHIIDFVDGSQAHKILD